jgi:hydroxymethylpyrimidine/phosphomethylpyrimidine kinase
LVVDPVMVATSGDVLLEPDAIDAVRHVLLPRAHVVTPNLPEAARLLDTTMAETEAQVEEQGRGICSRFGCRSVLMKGGHGSTVDAVDLLIEREGPTLRLAAPRIDTRHTHGTGCTLSAAIAAGLAKGLGLEAAVRGAHAYLNAAIRAAERLSVGHGHGPVHHFHASTAWAP